MDFDMVQKEEKERKRLTVVDHTEPSSRFLPLYSVIQSTCIVQTRRVRKIGLLNGQTHDLPVTEHVRRLSGIGSTTCCQYVSEWSV